MKHLAILFAAVMTLASMSTEASAQNRLFGRIFRVQPSMNYSYQPTVQSYSQNVTRSYAPIISQGATFAPARNRTPQPISGYGSNLHRNYMIRRAQKKFSETGIQPQNTANILWSR